MYHPSVPCGAQIFRIEGFYVYDYLGAQECEWSRIVIEFYVELRKGCR